MATRTLPAFDTTPELVSVEMGEGNQTRLAVHLGDHVVVRTPRLSGKGLGATAPGSVMWVLSASSKALTRLEKNLTSGALQLAPCTSKAQVKRMNASVRTLSSFLTAKQVAKCLADAQAELDAKAEAKAAKEQAKAKAPKGKTSKGKQAQVETPVPEASDDGLDARKEALQSRLVDVVCGLSAVHQAHLLAAVEDALTSEEE